MSEGMDQPHKEEVMKATVTTKKVVEGVSLQLTEEEAKLLKLILNLRVRVVDTIYHATSDKAAAMGVNDLMFAMWNALHKQDIHADVHVQR
jgi:hypothetical protein